MISWKKGTFCVMYIIKNAFRCIGRAKARNILIGIITLVIALSACIGLSIRQASESAKAETLAGLSVTATISFDRQGMMNEMAKPEEGGTPMGEAPSDMGGGFDRDEFTQRMSQQSSLTLAEYQSYGEASTVQEFYYTQTVYFNGSDSFEAVSEEETVTATDTQSSGDPSQGMMGMMGGKGDMMGNRTQTGDFTLIGYSGENAMTDFTSGISSVTDGTVFTQGTEQLDCIISSTLAVYNDCQVGDTIQLTNPNNEEETYTLTVVGIYTSSNSNDNRMSVFGIGQDPANEIYLSYPALASLVASSESNSQTLTDEDTGREYETALSGELEAVYVFADVEDYETFTEEVYTLGLSEDYTVSSQDLTAFENSLTPLTTLSTMAGWFLLVILMIGGVVLVVLNLFHVRERKYEIGVLTAMGMKKGKVALQFITEILVVTMVAVIIGSAVGAAVSVPVTNALLANQVESQTQQKEQIETNFGRPGGEGQDETAGEMPQMEQGEQDAPGGGFAGYITKVDSAVNLTVVLQMMAIGLLLTLAAGGVSVLSVMRYDPLKILANRD